MSVRRLIQSPRFRRSVAASAIVLSLGGLVLFRAPSGVLARTASIQVSNGSGFSHGQVSGNVALSQTKLDQNGVRRVFARVTVNADQANVDSQRAPLSLVIMLDTSGSMGGGKIVEARQSVVRLLERMHDDDEVALVRYDSQARIVRGMTRVGSARLALISAVREMQATGGTNIPAAMHEALSAMRNASRGRVKRMVLVSDGLDSTRAQSEAIARNGGEAGITVSALGVGLDFDESYMAGVANAGRGNFAFVQNASSLARFLERELEETANTTVENAVARMTLPAGVKLGSVAGADVVQLGARDIQLRLGSLFAGDKRRVVVELFVDEGVVDSLRIVTQLNFMPRDGRLVDLQLGTLEMQLTDNVQSARDSRDSAVHADCISALASVRQLQAADAYRNGFRGKAQQLIDENIRDLSEAAVDAPAEAAEELERQQRDYASTKGEFAGAAPGSAEGKRAAKSAAAKDSANLGRKSY